MKYLLKPVLAPVLATGLLLALGACAAGSPAAEHAASGGVLAQFILGFWHGLIAPVTLIVEVINRLMPHVIAWSPHMFESKATEVPYDVGFYLGLAGGPTFVWSRRPRRTI